MGGVGRVERHKGVKEGLRAGALGIGWADGRCRNGENR